jgi:beta-glucanase (GH16 family)
MIPLSLLGRLAAVIAFALPVAGCGDPTSAGGTNWTLVWEDNFDGPAGQLPSSSNWGFDLGTDWGNAQLEYDTDRAQNASLDGNGHLAIVARQESYQGRSYTSARMTTRGKREQTRGRFEARIKLPQTQAGIWPAFWLLGGDPTGWPGVGEIDVMENFGRQPSRVQGALHGPGYSGANSIYRAFDLPNGERFDADFHVFAIEWIADQVSWFVDDSLYQVVKKSYVPGDWVFDHPFYLILNLAVGGGPAGPPDGGTSFPQTMLVDWVRAYSESN